MTGILITRRYLNTGTDTQREKMLKHIYKKKTAIYKPRRIPHRTQKLSTLLTLEFLSF